MEQWFHSVFKSLALKVQHSVDAVCTDSFWAQAHINLGAFYFFFLFSLPSHISRSLLPPPPREGTGIKSAALNPADLAPCLAHLQTDGADGGAGTEAQGSLENPVINAVPTSWSKDNWL